MSRHPGPEVRVVPASAQRWPDVVTVFGRRGDPSWCWCQCFVTTGQAYTESAELNRAALRRQVTQGSRPQGLLAYRGDEPVGWLQLGPRADFPRVTRSRTVAAALGDRHEHPGMWRTTCFVVRVGHRRRGVATALLDGALGFAREHGAAALEGHPVDVAARTRRPGGAELYHGALSTFLRAGFVEVGRTGPTRPLVRRRLDDGC